VSNPYRDKLLSVGVISKRSRPLVREGREHPESGARWKAVEDETTIITEHNTKNDRVDATVKIQEPIRDNLTDMKDRARKARAQSGQERT
jgi:hypothetical protein